MTAIAWVSTLRGPAVAATLVRRIPTESPAVTLAASASSITAAGPLTLTASIGGAVPIARVRFYSGAVGSGMLLATVTAAPWRHTLPLAAANNGIRTYYAVAEDSFGNVGTSQPVSVAVAIGTSSPLSIPDATLPTGRVGDAYAQQIAFTAPSGSIVTGSNVPPGFTLSSSGLLSSATSPLAGTWQIDVTVSKAGYTSASARITVTIQPAVAAGRTASAWATKLQG